MDFWLLQRRMLQKRLHAVLTQLGLGDESDVEKSLPRGLYDDTTTALHNAKHTTQLVRSRQEADLVCNAGLADSTNSCLRDPLTDPHNSPKQGERRAHKSQHHFKSSACLAEGGLGQRGGDP